MKLKWRQSSPDRRIGPSWRAWSSRDPLDERAFEQMVLGISTRRYTCSLEALPNEFEVRGSGKSAVSERFVVGTRRRLAEKLMRRDLNAHPGAAGSLREGLEETLIVMRLDLPESLDRVLSSTNLIENLFSRLRDTARRVKRWQGGMMILRWTAAGVLEAGRYFRKVAGYRALPKLVAALRAHDASLARVHSVENGKRAA